MFVGGQVAINSDVSSDSGVLNINGVVFGRCYGAVVNNVAGNHPINNINTVVFRGNYPVMGIHDIAGD